MQVIIGLDQGSSSSKAILIDFSGKVHWESSVSVATQEHADGADDADNRVEQQAQELLESIKNLISQGCAAAKQLQAQIYGIGLTCQRSGVLAFNKSGKALHPLITWRDRRTLHELQQASQHFDFLREKSGLPVLPDYSGSKIAYLQKKFPDNSVFVGTLDSYLIYNLSDEKAFITDHSMAARSLAYDLEKGEWGIEQCKILGINLKRLPRIVCSTGSGVHIQGLPLKAITGDGQAALIAVVPQFSAVLNLGTISSICVFTSDQLRQVPGFIASVCYANDSQRFFMLEGVTNASGSVFKYLAENLPIKDINEHLAKLVLPPEQPKALAYLPLRGTATPDWRYDLPVKFEPSLNSLHYNDALLAGSVSVANFICRNINLLIDHGYLAKRSKVIVSGGISNFSFLLSYISAVCDIQLLPAGRYSGSAFGIARLAEAGNEQFRALVELDTGTVTPVTPGPDWCRSYHKRWLEFEQQIYLNVTTHIV